MDDIKDDHLTNLEDISEKDQGVPPLPGEPKPHREIGPESEVRGGPEAPAEA